jgi:hypothetical protein
VTTKFLIVVLSLFGSKQFVDTVLMVSVEYVIETGVFGVSALCGILVTGLQIFYAWRLPHNNNKVQILHKITMIPVFVNSILALIMCIDLRGVYHIYPIELPGVVAIIMTYQGVIMGLVWYKETVELVYVTNKINSLKRFISRLRIKMVHAWVLMSLHVAISIGFMVIAERTRQLWFFAIMSGYLMVMVLFISLSCFFLTSIIWRQFKSVNVKNRNLITAISGENFVEDEEEKIKGSTSAIRPEDSVSHSLSTSMVSKSPTLLPSLSASEGAGVKFSASTSASHLTTVIGSTEKRDRYLKISKITFAVGFVCACFVPVLVITTIHIATGSLTIESVLKADPDKYTFNSDIFSVYLAICSLGILAMSVMWLPIKPPRSIVERASKPLH